MSQTPHSKIRNKYFGIHVEPNTYIETNAKNKNDNRLEIVKEFLSKKLAIDPRKIKIINFADLDKEKFLCFIGCKILNLPTWKEVTVA